MSREHPASHSSTPRSVIVAALLVSALLISGLMFQVIKLNQQLSLKDGQLAELLNMVNPAETQTSPVYLANTWLGSRDWSQWSSADLIMPARVPMRVPKPSEQDFAVDLRVEPTVEERIASLHWMDQHSLKEKHMMLRMIPAGSPLAVPEVTSRFGYRIHPVHGSRRLHGGIDFRAEIGTPVYATADGLVEWAGPHTSGLGTMIKLNHNFGFATTYSHLKSVNVRPRDYVKKGTLIGYTGNTGVSNAPHLHYEVLYLYKKLDPTPFVDWNVENFSRIVDAHKGIRWKALARNVTSLGDGQTELAEHNPELPNRS